MSAEASHLHLLSLVAQLKSGKLGSMSCFEGAVTPQEAWGPAEEVWRRIQKSPAQHKNVRALLTHFGAHEGSQKSALRSAIVMVAQLPQPAA